MNTKHTELLDVSLIIATYNEEESLGYVLEEIEDFNIGEIIIIDKNSGSGVVPYLPLPELKKATN